MGMGTDQGRKRVKGRGKVRQERSRIQVLKFSCTCKDLGEEEPRHRESKIRKRRMRRNAVIQRIPYPREKESAAKSYSEKAYERIPGQNNAASSSQALEGKR